MRIKGNVDDTQENLDIWLRNSGVEPSTKVHEGHRVQLAGSYPRGTVRIPRLRCLDCPGQPRFSNDRLSTHSRLFPWVSRYGDDIAMGVINGYVDARMSYRGLGLYPPGNKISPATAYRWIRAVARQCKTPLEASIELKPVWGGSLQLDAFHVSVEGLARWDLLTLDYETRDIPHARVLRDEKDPRRIARMCIELKDVLHYRPKIVVVDENPSLVKAVRSVYPSVPIQLCVWHKKRAIDRILPDRKINTAVSELKAKIREFLFATTLNEADVAYRFITDNSHIWPETNSQDAIMSIKRDQEALSAHFYVDQKLGLTGEKRTPRTTSLTEGTISRFRLKLDQMRGFKSLDNLPGMLNLLIMHQRAVAFRSGRDRRSPLERAQRPVSNWLLFSKRKSNNETERLD
jgi:hypothetical protein